jgi:hypothetical protein
MGHSRIGRIEMNAIKLTTKQARPIVKLTFPEYHGRKFTLEFTDHITFYDTNWSGGTKNVYAFLRSDGAVRGLTVPAPWVNPVEGLTVEIPKDILVVVHQYFCGMDTGITVYASPLNSPKWLTAAEPDNRTILRER